MERRAWWATVHRVTKSWTQLSYLRLSLSFTFRVSLEQTLFCDYINLTSDDSMTRVLFSLTGGNVNMCELWKLFGLCFLVLLFQASWNVTPLILRSFLSQRFRNVPLPISRALCNMLSCRFYHSQPTWTLTSVLDMMFCRNCIQAVIWGQP